MKVSLKPNIREKRMEKHMTQIELAKKIKMPKSELSSFERGRHFPGPEKLWLIAYGIGCKVDDLYICEVVE